MSHNTVRKLLVSQGTMAWLWPCVPFQRHTGDSHWVGNRASTTAESRWNSTWQVQGQGKFMMSYIMYILDICIIYTLNILCISKNFALYIQKIWIGYTLYMPSICQVFFLYMHDIHHAYTMYIKEFWTVYPENLNGIYIVYVKYIPIIFVYIHCILYKNYMYILLIY